jgi:hypothetical protein
MATKISSIFLLTILGLINAFPHSHRHVQGFQQRSNDGQAFQQQSNSWGAAPLTPQASQQTIHDPSGIEQAVAFGNENNAQSQQQQPSSEQQAGNTVQQPQQSSLEQSGNNGQQQPQPSIEHTETTKLQGGAYSGQQSTPSEQSQSVAQSPPLEQTPSGAQVPSEELPPLEQPTPVEQTPIESKNGEPIDSETDSSQIIVESLTEAQRSHLITYFICQMCEELQVSMCTRMCRGETDGSGSGAEIEGSGEETEASGSVMESSGEEPSIVIVFEETDEASGEWSNSGNSTQEASGKESESSGFGELEGSGN